MRYALLEKVTDYKIKYKCQKTWLILTVILYYSVNAYPCRLLLFKNSTIFHDLIIARNY